MTSTLALNCFRKMNSNLDPQHAKLVSSQLSHEDSSVCSIYMYIMCSYSIYIYIMHIPGEQERRKKASGQDYGVVFICPSGRCTCIYM